MTIKNKMVKKPIAAAVSAAFLTTLSATPFVNAAEDPFATTELSSGYLLAGNHEKSEEGKCGEGKCGTEKGEEGKCGEGKCGEDKDKPCDREKSDKEGKCGEGKCGESAESTKDGEGKCGEGKCGTESAEESEEAAE